MGRVEVFLCQWLSGCANFAFLDKWVSRPVLKSTAGLLDKGYYHSNPLICRSRCCEDFALM